MALLNAEHSVAVHGDGAAMQCTGTPNRWVSLVGEYMYSLRQGRTLSQSPVTRG